MNVFIALKGTHIWFLFLVMWLKYTLQQKNLLFILSKISCCVWPWLTGLKDPSYSSRDIHTCHDRELQEDWRLPLLVVPVTQTPCWTPGNLGSSAPVWEYSPHLWSLGVGEHWTETGTSSGKTCRGSRDLSLVNPIRKKTSLLNMGNNSAVLVLTAETWVKVSSLINRL